MKKKTIAVIAALDTKGEEAQYICDLIWGRGHRTMVIDVGIMDRSGPDSDISSDQVAEAGGSSLANLRLNADKSRAMEVMTRGAAEVAARLYAEKRFDGMIGIGGTAGTAISASAMRTLPIGTPKVLVSTVASGDVRPYVGTKDITMMYSVVDISGMNRISTRILANAAGAVIGMVETTLPTQANRPLIAASMFGNTTACVDRARAVLVEAGYEVLVFHATGVGGATMESLIAEGFVDGVLDVTTTEWADELCGGVFSAGPARLDAAAKAGVPQVVAPGCLDMVNFWAPETVPTEFASRRLFRWNPNVTLMRTNIEENRKLGKILAEKLNKSTGPISVLLPLRGISQLDTEGGEFWWPQADQALFDTLRQQLRSDIPIIELETVINDPVFAECAAQTLLDLIKQRGQAAGLVSERKA